MGIIAIGMMKDEADIAHACVTNLFNQGVDQVYVLDNNSSDGTAIHVVEAGGVVFHDPEVAYLQSDKLTALAAKVAIRGDWVLPFDADEIWQGLHWTVSVADMVTRYGASNVIRGLMIDHVNVGPPVDSYANPIEDMPYHRVETTGYAKVMYRWDPAVRIEQGNHGVAGIEPKVATGVLDVHHFQYRGYEHFKRKMIAGAKAYDDPRLPADWGNHWRDAGALYEREGDAGMRELYRTKHTVPNVDDAVYSPVYI